jgi:hypothetical protein
MRAVIVLRKRKPTTHIIFSDISVCLEEKISVKAIIV